MSDLADIFAARPAGPAVIAAPDALFWSDLSDAPPEASGERQLPVSDSQFVGTLTADCAVLHDEIDLDVLQDPAREWIEIGPFRLKTPEAQRLLRWLREYLALAGAYRWVARQPAPESGRGIAGRDLAVGTGDRPACGAGDRPVAPTMARNLDGRAHCPPWEGETLP